MTSATSIAVFSSMVLLACSPSSRPAAEDAAATKSTVETTTAAFHQALRTNDSVAFMSYIDDSVNMMPPGEGPVRGRETLRAWYSSFLSQYHTSSLTLGNREVIVGDAWAVEIGTYEWGLTPTAGGAAVVDKGNYMQVWKKQPDNTWKFAREIWNSSIPAK